MRAIILAAAGLFLATAAHAEEAKPSSPCAPNTGTTVVLGGVDINDLKCQAYQAFLVAQEGTAQIIVLKARVAKLEAQLAAETARVDGLEKYGKTCGDKPGCWAAVPGAAGPPPIPSHDDVPKK